MMRFTILFACVVATLAEAPLPEYGLPYPAAKTAPYPAPHEEYGVPKLVEEHKPVVPVVTKYAFDIPEAPKKIVKEAPYPAPVPVVKVAPYPAPHDVYGVPENEQPKPVVPVLTKYSYEIPAKPIVKIAPYPAPTPIKPHVEYGVPVVEKQKPVVPVVTKYHYDIPKTTPKPAPYPALVPVVKVAPYPAPAPIVKVVKPHDVYGVPEVEQPKPIVPVVTKYHYEIPNTTPKPAPYPKPVPVVKVAPYPAPTPIIKVVKPHDVYGIPEIEQPKPVVPIVSKYHYDIPITTSKPAPYPTSVPIVKVAPYPAPTPIFKVVTPHDIYGVPKIEQPKPVVPVITKYHYDIPKTTPKPASIVKVAPYPASVPHQVYGPPAAKKVVEEVKTIVNPIVNSYKYEIPITTAAPKVVPHAVYGVPSYF